MKNLFIAIVAAIAFLTLNPKPAAAEVEIETAASVAKVIVHGENFDGASWKTEVPVGGRDVVNRPCPERSDSRCLYTVDARGREKEVFSYSIGVWSQVRYVFAPAKPAKKAKR